jgi:hypothetical protein
VSLRLPAFVSLLGTLVAHQSRNQTQWVIEGFLGTSAEGTEEQLKAFVSVLNDLVGTQRNVADRLQSKASLAEQGLSSLRSALNYAIASRRTAEEM